MGTSSEFLRPAKVAERYGFAKSTLWEWVKTKPNFPKPNRISARCVLFSVAELDAFIKSEHGGSSVVGARLLEGRKRKARAQLEKVVAEGVSA
ncbi:MAG: AlpA family phage regulatory protein [Rhodoferax sp.]|nr:AlpA family phage regulatory protein [Rhodoferax sp.]